MSHELAVASIAGMLDASDEESLAIHLQNGVTVLGFERFVLCVEIKRPVVGRVQYVTRGYPLTWHKIYQECDHTALNSAGKDSRQNTTPKVGPDQPRPSSPAELWEEVLGHGISFGISLPAQEKAGVTSMLNLSRDIPLPKDADEAQQLYSSARILSACLHLATVRTLVPALLARNDPQLSERERECVSWAAHGKTSEEIGKQLHISEPTVVFHINKVVRKLGVRNRMHAVALSVALGLVN